MSQQTGVLDITFKAAGDLDDKQYYIVKMSAADTIDLAGANTDHAIGVLQNKPKTGEAAVIRVLGTTKYVSHGGSAVSVGNLICPDSNGKGEVADADLDFVIGIALEASAADNDILEMLLTHFQANIS